MRIHGHVTRLPELPAPAGSEAAPGRACPSREVRVLGLGTRPGQEVGSGHHGGCCHWLTRSSVQARASTKLSCTVAPWSTNRRSLHPPPHRMLPKTLLGVEMELTFAWALSSLKSLGMEHHKGRAGCLETSTASSMFCFPALWTQLPSRKPKTRDGEARRRAVLFSLGLSGGLCPPPSVQRALTVQGSQQGRAGG